jgi:hypothetical protein
MARVRNAWMSCVLFCFGDEHISTVFIKGKGEVVVDWNVRLLGIKGGVERVQMKAIPFSKGII